MIGVVDLQFSGGGYSAPLSEQDAIERTVAASRAQVVYTGARTVEEVPARDLQTFDALMFRRCRVAEPSLALMPKLRCVIRMGVGYENLDVHACRARGIVACNMPDSWIEEVADTTLSHLLSLVRRTHILAVHVASGHGWTQQANLPSLGLTRIRGMRLGIVGCGRIGTAVAMRAHSFGLKTSFFDPYLQYGMEKGLGLMRYDSLDDLLANSDIVSLHCPYTDATHHLLRSETLPNHPIYVINCSRGGLLHEADLLEALSLGRVLGLGLDCLEAEPEVSTELSSALANPSLNLLVTAHSSFYSNEAYAEMRRTATLEALRVIEGQSPRYQIE